MLIFADTANLADIERLTEHPDIAGFTTNPTLFRAEGVDHALTHAKEIVRLTSKPVSIDGPLDIIRDLGPNVIPKIVVPVDRDPPRPDCPVNYTAVICNPQIERAAAVCRPDDIVSVFAGRIADAGRDATWAMADARTAIRARLLWASTRQLYNLREAHVAGCDIITLTPALFDKMPMVGMRLDYLAADTIDQFRRDGEAIQW